MEKEVSMKRQSRVLLVGMMWLATLVPAWAQEKLGDPQHGQTVYKQHCARCHGPEGDGRGPDAGSLTIKPANFLSPDSRSQSDEYLLHVIVWGTVYSPMHGWWDRLAIQDMRDALAYIRNLASRRSQ